MPPSATSFLLLLPFNSVQIRHDQTAWKSNSQPGLRLALHNEIAFRSVGIQNSLVYLLGTRREPLGYISFLETASSIRAWHYANVWKKIHVFIASSCCDTILKHCLAWLFWSFSLKYCWYTCKRTINQTNVSKHI